MQSACVWGFLHTGNLGHLKEYGWISNTATAAELNLLSSPAGERQRGGSRRERGEEERRRRRKGVCVKRTRYEGRQRREKQRGRDLSEETALAGAQRQRAKKKEGVEKGGGRRMEGWGEWTYPLFADCCLLMDHFKFNDGKERVNHKYKLINPAWPALLQREKTLCNQKDAGGSEEVMSSADWPRCFDSKLCLDRVDPIAPGVGQNWNVLHLPGVSRIPSCAQTWLAHIAETVTCFWSRRGDRPDGSCAHCHRHAPNSTSISKISDFFLPHVLICECRAHR